ncbi:MAG: ATP synthase F1 subunit gamma [Dehalococcoidia bacterium]
MANIRVIKRRIRSVQNTAKITRAMEMVAASKMRRAQERVLAARPYAEKMREMLSHLASQSQDPDAVHPLLQKRETNRIEILHITPDRGLCGGLVSNINRATSSFILQGDGVEASLVTVGKKGRDFMTRYGREVRAVFIDLGDRPGVLDVLPIARIVIDDYASGYADKVYLAYSRFVTTTNQEPVITQILPIEPVAAEEAVAAIYIYEPDSVQVLGELLPRFVEMQIYHAVLEAIASEQSARMVAMRNATDNANEMIDELTLMFNKARQEAITTELLDITGGVAALEG